MLLYLTLNSTVRGAKPLSTEIKTHIVRTVSFSFIWEMVSERSEGKKIKPGIKDDKVCVLIIMSGYAPFTNKLVTKKQ